MVDETKLITLPSILISRPMKSAIAKASADLKLEDLSEASAKALLDQEWEKAARHERKS
jgi:hypothetical protein